MKKKNNINNNAQNCSQSNMQNCGRNNAQNCSQNSKQNNTQNNKKIIDLTSYISPDMVQSDTQGSYTGTTEKTYYTGEYEEPVQDADDL